MCCGAELEQSRFLPLGNSNRFFEEAHRAGQIVSASGDLATNADAFSQDACFVGIDNEAIDLIQQLRYLVEATRPHQKITQPACSLWGMKYDALAAPNHHSLADIVDTGIQFTQSRARMAAPYKGIASPGYVTMPFADLDYLRSVLQ